ncbi:type II toxin-antitoxin system VapB family antitoxin [Tomitella fengzijianii]|uniref:Ribbon-helix-helix protein, CopG family n=1 Tax=Tomitella fengzijianii TaxID=2597660 RepID=A0A516X233_9ACTN|nr:type II toxin-antitoxin system VapB family antitoxin [Tomitella fengzijianii]QDQ97113.1 ribbon-helix-helix protein, CopG family [Tomitella fengzijianii]
MKTTFDLPEPVLRRVQEIARLRGTTTKSLVEEALRDLIDRQTSADMYTLPDCSVSGRGLQPEFSRGWDSIRDAAYGQSA